MEKSIRKDDMLHALIDAKADWVLAPNAFPSGSPKASAARHHGDVDSDWARLEATLGRMTASKDGRLSRFSHHHGPKACEINCRAWPFPSARCVFRRDSNPSARWKRRETDLNFRNNRYEKEKCSTHANGKGPSRGRERKLDRHPTCRR